jgi:beta-glucuronidase
MIQNASARAALDLSGRWRVIVDPYEAGYRGFHGDPWPFGFFRNAEVRPGLCEYDFDRAELLEVPGDWNSQDPKLLYYEGTLWYQTRFRLEERPGVRRFLHFGAANYHAMAWLDGELLGEHAGGFTPFEFELPGAGAAGEHVLTVKVDNTRRREAVPTVNTDWWNYGGLTREVRVLEVPETFVREYTVGLGDPGHVRARVVLDGARRRQTVHLRIPEAGLEVSGETDDDGLVELVAEAQPERWSPARPRRYRVEISCENDAIAELVGFRMVCTEGARILLNDEPIFLRGVSLHEEVPFGPGRAWSEEHARTLLGWAVELGCNFVRLAHYPHNETMVRVAEELGLLVWAEIPVYWNIAWGHAPTLECAKAQLEELIARDRNRCAVILWSLSNEAPATEARQAFLAELARYARALDSTRLLTSALFARFDEGAKTMVIEDPVGEHLDVMGCNEYLGWYYREPEEMDRIGWSSLFDKPLIMSEFGAGAVAGREGDTRTPFTEEHQAHVYRKQIDMLRRIPFLAGLSPWILKDFRTPRRVLAGVQDGWNRKGLVSDRGLRKRAFAVLREWYRELAGKAGSAVPPQFRHTRRG